MGKGRAALVWIVLGFAVTVAIVAAATSPLLAWREPPYIIAGIAGVVALALLVYQPLFAVNRMPGLGAMAARRWHRRIGRILMLLIVVHVVGLWVTSPPDVVDAMLFRSPTPFSFWGVLAMWSAFAATALATGRHRLNLPGKTWHVTHVCLAVVTVVGTVVHALLIEGTMEPISKAVICVLVLGVTVIALRDSRRGG